jgi:pimeloyl-ACP methyl ester carboxylesterase
VTRPRPSRRALLLGGLGVGAVAVTGVAVGVEEEVLPGRTWVRDRLGLNGEAGRVPDVTPGRVVHGSFRSEARGGVETGWSIAYPPGTQGSLPVLVVLHGLGNDDRSAMSPYLGLDRFLAAGVKDGLAPFAIASVDGGRSYWHRRPDGEDAGAMVLDEFVPLLADRGLRTDRIGLFGWSMGGYATLRLGAVLGRARCAAVVAESPALWTDGANASASGFRDAEEYAEFSVFGHQEDLAGIPVRIDCGTGDPFYRATQAYVAGFPRTARPSVHFQPGAHEMAYWRRMATAQLCFVARHLA